MRKEVIIAIFAGLAIGLIIAFGVWRINFSQPQVSNPNGKENQNPISESNGTSVTNFSNKLSLTGIEDGEIFTESPVNVQGVASGSNMVVISGQTEDYIIEVEPDSTWKASIKLIKGINTITLVALSTAGVENDRLTFTVVYYPEFDKTQDN